MALTAREWLLLPESEQKQRGKELSPKECFKLRMELSEIHLTEEEKQNLTKPPKKTAQEIEAYNKTSFKVLKDFKILPENITYEKWIKDGKPLNYKN